MTSPSPTPPPQRSAAKRLRHRAEYAGLYAARAVLARMPLPLVRAVANAAGALAAHLDRGGRATALENLRAALGDTHSPAARARIVGRCYRHFARTFLEFIRASRLPPAASLRLCAIRHEDEAATLAAVRDGAIFITPHYGNFEWMAMSWCQLGHPLVFVAQDSKNPLVTPLLVADRSRCGNTVIPRQGALLRLLRALKSGKQVGLLPDLTTAPENNAVVIRMFGLKSSVTSLPALLAQRTGCAVIPAICLPNPDGTHTGHFCRPLRFAPDISPAAASQSLWDIFEPFIRNQPEPWLWMYKRWRYLPQDAAQNQYPAYANRSKAFDRIDSASHS